jgi:ABC-2 type transport system permease protein
MLGIVLRSLKNNKGSLAIYSIASIGFLEVYVSMFPFMQQQSAQLSDMLKLYPESLMKAFGFDSSQLLFDQIGSFLATEQFSFMWPIMAIIFLVSYSNSSIVGEIENGTVEVLLSQPISRTKIFFGRYFAGLINLFVFTFASVFAVVPLALLHDIKYNTKGLLAFSIEAFLFGAAIFSLAMLASSLFSEKGKANIITIGVLISMYVANIVSSLKPSLSDLQYFSFFHYYNPASALVKNTFPDWTLIVFIGFSLVVTAVAAVWFNKRDVAV